MSKPQIAKLSPYAVDVEKGQEYFWCRCGRRQTVNAPMCDGTHNRLSEE
jgi:CDGSH-type Zn-finger protein